MPMFQPSVSGDWRTQATDLNPRPLAVMSSPATITVSDTNPLASGLFVAAATAASTLAPYPTGVSLFGAGRYIQLGTSHPDYNFLGAQNITSGLSGSVFYKTGHPRVSFITRGTQFVMGIKAIGVDFLVKINNEFVSLTPTTIALGSPSVRYVLVDNIGSAGVDKRIDILFNLNFAFAGVFVPATETVSPAPRRGRKMVLMTDSFGEGTGNEVSTVWAWPNVFAEYLGWDDVIASCVGSTGLTYAVAPKVTFRQRLQRDVIDLAPEEIGVCLSINDSAATAASVLSEAQLIVSEAKAQLPNVKFTFFSPTSNRGAGGVPSLTWQQHKAVRDWCANNGHKYVSDIEQPIPQTGRHTATVTANANVGATSVSVSEKLLAGSVYEYGGIRLYVRSSTTTSATIDNAQSAIPSGATLTQVGSHYLTGLGRVGALTGWGNCDQAVSSDVTHPTNYGHQLKGSILARQYASGMY